MALEELYKAIKNAPIVRELYEEDTGLSVIVIKYNNLIGLGLAKCAPQDKPIYSKVTGGHVAHFKAMLDLCKQMKGQILFYNPTEVNKVRRLIEKERSQYLQQVEKYGHFVKKNRKKKTK